MTASYPWADIDTVGSVGAVLLGRGTLNGHPATIARETTDEARIRNQFGRYQAHGKED
jgi:hypothetical protein